MSKNLDKNTPILLDCDGVVGGFNELATAIARDRGFDVTVDDCKGDCRATDWWKGSGLEEDWLKKGFCESIPVLPGSQEFVEKLRDMGLRVVFVTSPPKDNPTWPHERRLWLEKHFGARRVDVMFAVDKRYVHGLAFLDDHVRNILDWQEYNGGRGILIKRPWNEDILPDCSSLNVFSMLDEEKVQLLWHNKRNQNVVRSNDWESILKVVELVKEKTEISNSSQKKESAS